MKRRFFEAGGVGDAERPGGGVFDRDEDPPTLNRMEGPDPPLLGRPGAGVILVGAGMTTSSSTAL